MSKWDDADWLQERHGDMALLHQHIQAAPTPDGVENADIHVWRARALAVFREGMDLLKYRAQRLERESRIVRPHAPGTRPGPLDCGEENANESAE